MSFKDLRNCINSFDSIFNNSIEVHELLKCNRVYFEKRDKKILFFKKKKTEPLNLIDLTLNKIYDDFVNDFSLLSVDNNINGLRFGFYYYNSEMPVNGYVYDNYKKFYVLSDITKRSYNNKILINYDSDFLKNQYNNLLNYISGDVLINYTTLVYKGYFDVLSRNTLKDYINGNVNVSFNDLILNFFGKTITNNVYGVVIKNYDNTYVLKCFNDNIDDVNSNNFDSYKTIVKYIIDFVNSNLDKIDFKSFGKNYYSNYINLINLCFNKLVEDLKIDFNNEFKDSKKSINLNLKYIKNIQTLSYLDKNDFNKILYSIFLELFTNKSVSKIVGKVYDYKFNSALKKINKKIIL